MNTLKMIDLAAEYQNLKAELEPAVLTVLADGDYIKGKEVTIFEQALARELQVHYVISCANGTDALQIALMALGVGKEDEVIIPAFAYISVIEVICLLGATPVLVDVDAQTFQIDANLIIPAITKKTKAIIPVHLFGYCGDMTAILKIAAAHQLYVIEDNAQALGAKYQLGKQELFLGTLGNVGCTSFFPTKNLACFGDGGALFTSNEVLSNQIRMIANHGQKVKYEHEVIGLNSRLDSLQAAILNIKLKYLSHQIAQKQSIAHQYQQELKNIKEVQTPVIDPNCKPAFHQFTIKVSPKKRDALKNYLQQQGIESMVYYPKALHQQKAYRTFNRDLPVAAHLCQSVLSLPIHSLLKTDDVAYCCQHIKSFFNE